MTKNTKKAIGFKSVKKKLQTRTPGEREEWKEDVQRRKIEEDERREYKKTQEYRDYLLRKKKQVVINNRKSKQRKYHKESVVIAIKIMTTYDGVCKIMNENPNFVIFDDGTIWNIKKRKWLGTSKHICGYVFANAKFYVKGEKKQMLLHRLVAMNLIPNPDNLPEVNHRNFCKADCSVQNLEWCDKRTNMDHYWDTQEKANTSNSFKAIPVLQYTMDDKLIAEYPSIATAAKETGTSSQCLAHAIRGRLKSSNGFRWRIKETID